MTFTRPYSPHAKGTVYAGLCLTVAVALSCSGGNNDAPPPTQPPHVVVASVRISPTTPALDSGESLQFTATPLDAAGATISGGIATWSSSNASVALVTSSGMMTADASGTATLSATIDGVTGATIVTVRSPGVASVVLSTTALSLDVGQTGTIAVSLLSARGAALTGRTVTWASSAPGVATASQTGVVTGVAPGSATITASSEGFTASAAVTITPAPPAPVARVELSAPSVTLEVGEPLQEVATPRDANDAALAGRTIAWSSDTPGVASVTSAGLITAVAVGTATIAATSEGRSATARVVVTPRAAASVQVSPSDLSMIVLQGADFMATVTDRNGSPVTGRTVTWTSSASSVATVSTAGHVVAFALGTAVIAATADGVSGSAVVSVIPVPVQFIDMRGVNRVELVPGDSRQMWPTIYGITNEVLTDRSLTWVSSNPAIATVSGTGSIYAVAAGTAVVTASTGGKTATIQVLVGAVRDQNPPVIAAFVSLAPTALDVTLNADSAILRLRITDFQSGMSRGSVYLFPSNSQPSNRCTPSLESGTPQDGVWRCAFVFAAGSVGATWTLGQVTLFDALGNSLQYSDTDLATLGWNATVRVTRSP